MVSTMYVYVCFGFFRIDVLVVKAQEKECKKKKNVLIVVEKALKGIHVISLDTMVSIQ